MTCARGINIDSWVDTTLCNLAIEAKFHVAGSLEFFENGIVHAAVRFNKRSSQNGQASAFFNVASSTKEFLWWVQRTGIDTTRHDSPSCRCCQVVCA